MKMRAPIGVPTGVINATENYKNSRDGRSLLRDENLIPQQPLLAGKYFPPSTGRAGRGKEIFVFHSFFRRGVTDGCWMKN